MARTVEELSLQPDEILHAVAKHKMDVRRCAQTLVDEICSFEHDFGDIVSMLAHHLELQNAEEMGRVVKVMFEKALAEPAHVEACARIALAARACYLTFPPENEHDEPIRFTRVLFNVCRNELEILPSPSKGSEMKHLVRFIGPPILAEAGVPLRLSGRLPTT